MTRQDDDGWIDDDEAEELELKSKQRVGTTHTTDCITRAFEGSSP